MTPTLVAARTALPPEGALAPWGGPAALVTPTLVAARTVRPAHERGFTLIELLVAITIMALLAILSWRGLDGMTRAHSQTQTRADQVLSLQGGLAQWAADLDAMTEVPQASTIDWNGRVLRIVRRGTAAAGEGVHVVGWTRRGDQSGGQWLRWQSPPLRARGELQEAWAKADQWSQNPDDAAKTREVVITPLVEWQVFYFRSDAWTNPQSSDGSVPSDGAAPVPEGVRVVLTLPPGQALNGRITRDWVRPTVGGGKS